MTSTEATTGPITWGGPPSILTMAAATRGGGQGATLWVVDYDTVIWVYYQREGLWRKDFAGREGPRRVTQITAAQQNNGCLRFWARGYENPVLSSIAEESPGGRWLPWEGPDWNHSGNRLYRLAAVNDGGTRGVRLFAVAFTERASALKTCYQLTPGGTWSDWEFWEPPGSSPAMVTVTAAQQNNGCAQVWVCDNFQHLWSATQDSGGKWGPLIGPDWNNAPPLEEIVACQQGGTRGAALWGLKGQTLTCCYQETPGGSWTGWSAGSWLDAPPATQLAAAQQADNTVRLWLRDAQPNKKLISIAQTSPGGDWGKWER